MIDDNENSNSSKMVNNIKKCDNMNKVEKSKVTWDKVSVNNSNNNNNNNNSNSNSNSNNNNNKKNDKFSEEERESIVVAGESS